MSLLQLPPFSDEETKAWHFTHAVQVTQPEMTEEDMKPLMKNCSVNKISIQELNVLTFKLVLFGPGFCHFSVL